MACVNDAMLPHHVEPSRDVCWNTRGRMTLSLRRVRRKLPGDWGSFEQGPDPYCGDHFGFVSAGNARRERRQNEHGIWLGSGLLLLFCAAAAFLSRSADRRSTLSPHPSGVISHYYTADEAPIRLPPRIRGPALAGHPATVTCPPGRRGAISSFPSAINNLQWS